MVSCKDQHGNAPKQSTTTMADVQGCAELNVYSLSGMQVVLTDM